MLLLLSENSLNDHFKIYMAQHLGKFESSHADLHRHQSSNFGNNAWTVGGHDIRRSQMLQFYKQCIKCRDAAAVTFYS